MRFIPAVSPVQIQSPLPCTGEMHRVSPVPRLWPVGQVVKTRPFHGCNMGSSPVRVTNGGLAQLVRAPASHAGGHWFESSSLHQNEKITERWSFLFICGTWTRTERRPADREKIRVTVWWLLFFILPVVWDRHLYRAVFSAPKPRSPGPPDRSCRTSDLWSGEQRRTSCRNRSFRPPYWAAGTPP